MENSTILEVHGVVYHRKMEELSAMKTLAYGTQKKTSYIFHILFETKKSPIRRVMNLSTKDLGVATLIC